MQKLRKRKAKAKKMQPAFYTSDFQCLTKHFRKVWMVLSQRAASRTFPLLERDVETGIDGGVIFADGHDGSRVVDEAIGAPDADLWRNAVE